MHLTWREMQVVQDLVCHYDGRPPKGVTVDELVDLYNKVRLLGGAREIAEAEIDVSTLDSLPDDRRPLVARGLAIEVEMRILQEQRERILEALG